jgi:hypothetical protein
MKYLKKFEGIFGPAEPEKKSQREWVEKVRSLGRDFFSKTEMQTLVDLMENSGREHMQEEEWENLGWSQKMDYYQIGLTYLSFYLPTYDGSNPNPYGVDITKCEDEWFMVSFYQDGGQDEEGEIYYEYEEYYECDGFDCTYELLKKEAKLR